jgi:DNA-binding response OmpR family regulator
MSAAKILVVDDSEIVLMGFKKVLVEEGFEVTVTTSPLQAIELAKKEKYDIVYTDLKMPELSGKDVCKRIKEISPSTEVAIFSGSPHAVVQDQFEIMDYGGKDYFLRKPLSYDEIITVTRKLLENKRQQ